jgi:uncharacterized protein YjbJ (UPF0337 family)
MDKDRVVGSAKQVKGAVKQAVGKAVGDAKLESEGQADKVEGKVQNAIGAPKTRSKTRQRKIGCELSFSHPAQRTGRVLIRSYLGLQDVLLTLV